MRPRLRPLRGCGTWSARAGTPTGDDLRGQFTNYVKPRRSFQRRTYMRRLLMVLAGVLVLDAVLLFGAKPTPVADVITREPTGATSRAAPRGSAGGSSTTAATTFSGTAAPAVNCTTPSPSPTWSCQNGVWMMVGTSTTSAAATGTGAATAASLDGGAGNCPSAQPGAGWTCRGGTWTPPNSSATTPSGAGSESAPIAPTQPGTSTGAAGSPAAAGDASPLVTPAQSGCTAPNPAAGMPGIVARCVNGTWVIGGL